jgi:aminopeptidase N
MQSSRLIVIALVFFTCTLSYSQKVIYTHSDSLKGNYSRERTWWDVNRYDLKVWFNYADSSIRGSNRITYSVLQPSNLLQVDLMVPLVIDSIIQDGSKCQWRKDGNAHFVTLNSEQTINSKKIIDVFYHGKPRAAKQPPWDGGVVWSSDSRKNPWISVACQGMSSQVWFPNKDHMADEAESASMEFTVPRTLVAVSNGKLKGIEMVADSFITYKWEVLNPINNYNITPYIGKYTMLKDTMSGKGGVLDIQYWVLEENYEKARTHFSQVKPMLRCFEYWFGKYPFYEDSYKLVEAPFLGMEHQSAIAYGNNYVNGYRGRDLSGTGWGLNWDFIIVHESGHEWFGNNISAKDVADNWIHEGFTAYSENLYTEYLFGKQAGAQYVIGTRAAVLNDKPVISDYGVNSGGSLDVYYKAANMLHTIRQLVNNDSLWRAMLQDINKTFWHQTVDSRQVEEYMSSFLSIDLRRIFDQYLRTTKIPILEYRIRRNKLIYRWTNCVKKFDMPVTIQTTQGEEVLNPTRRRKRSSFSDSILIIDPDYFIVGKQLK